MAQRIWGATGSSACLAAVALVLAGCGAGRQTHATNKLRALPPAQRASLIHLTNTVLATDQEAIFAYTFAGPLLSHLAQRADGRFLRDENTHAGVLRALIVRAGGTPHAPLSAYDLGDPRSEVQVLDMLRRLEQEQITMDLSVIPKIPSAWVRTVLASILANNAQHMTVLRSLQRLPPLQSAFVDGASTSASATPVVSPAPTPSDAALLAGLLRAELVGQRNDEQALRSAHLSRNLQLLLSGLAAREGAHAQALARLLGTPLSAVASTPSSALLLGLPRTWPTRRSAVIHRLQTVQSRIEGIAYAALPKLSAPAATLVASILAADAQHAALLGELESSRIVDAVPAALVRGGRIPSGSA